MRVRSHIRLLRARWRSRSPRFFRHVMKISLGVCAVCVLVNEALALAGAVPPAWWVDTYPYLVGGNFAALIVAKFTKEDRWDSNLDKFMRDGEHRIPK